MKNGLTLIEIMVSILILALGALVMFMYYPTVFEGVNVSSQTMKAFEIAKQEMEILKSSNFTDVLYSVSYAPEETPRINNFTNLTKQYLPYSSGVYYVKKMKDTTGNILDDLVDVEVVVCFSATATSRIIGEDQNLDGILQCGWDFGYYYCEDINNDAKINSAVTLRTLVLKK